MCVRIDGWYNYKILKGRSHTVEKRNATHPQKPYATSQPSRFSHTPDGWLVAWGFVGEWHFVFPLCGFSLSLFCNYPFGNDMKGLCRHGICVGACWVVSPQGGFSLSLFCNYFVDTCKTILFSVDSDASSPLAHVPATGSQR